MGKASAATDDLLMLLKFKVSVSKLIPLNALLGIVFFGFLGL